MSQALRYLVGTLEIGFAATGAVLLWRLILSPTARAQRRESRLAAWSGSITDFVAFLFLVLSGSFVAATAAGLSAKTLGFRGDAATVLNGAAAQLGMLAGVMMHRWRLDRRAALPLHSLTAILPSGVATFLISLPLLLGTAAAWEFLLGQFGLPTGRQDLIGMFANTESPWQLAVMISLAVLIAPLTEELVFRAGMFRFLRTRVPRWLALLLPAVFFALLHVNWHTFQGLSSLAPLVVLAVVFSLAYERTGQIGTCIVAHACFNLNTIVVIFSGLAI